MELATPDHFQYQPALDYWEQQAAEQVHFRSVTALGLMREGDLSVRLCTDACLAALAICAGSHSTEHRQHERAAKIHQSSAETMSSPIALTRQGYESN
ncbi:hypothetical protein [Synechococcus sp. ROS8604]|uniref:hypothetical protein n=1 Tax=Synechococcus sp. ROS8604 TaxID=1442557 RepID=UPI001861C4BC|nr:hypothetical protein [Synechococcus sp. ROS8604]QNI86941.1 hypothetical protein SynROS8604_00270 [Synechococcus sp. ROS8604]